MDFDKKNKIGPTRASAFSKIEKIHPLMMMLYLSLMGIGVLFLMLVIAYVQSHAFDTEAWKLKLPRFFTVSTFLLLLSSYTLRKSRRYYRKDNLKKLQRSLMLTLVLALVFVAAQVAGWQEVAGAGINFTELAAGTYLYLISALHAVHMLAGVLFLSMLLFRTNRAAADPIRTLVFIRNPFVRQQIKMLNTYWHFLGALWVCLFLIFLFTLKG
jgi:cytochrome c oxidase subunit III